MVIGTAGHIDHGKSSLVAALTGVHPDRLPEEKRRGITTDLGFGHLLLPTRPTPVLAGLVDVPGHERFVHTMAAGACGLDAVLLVVAADAGVQPQTREHVEICRLLDIRRGVVALTKSDLAPPLRRSAVRAQISALVVGGFLESAEIVEVSAAARTGIEELKRALARCAEAAAGQPDGDRSAAPFRLPLDRGFILAGFGTVVAGAVAQGALRVGDDLELVGSSRRLRLRGLHAYGQPVEAVSAGQRAALNLAGVEPAELRRGDVVAESGIFSLCGAFTAELDLLPGADLPPRARVRLHLLTADRVAGVIALPGGRNFARLHLDKPVAAAPGDRFILRQLSPARTIGGGRVLELNPRHGRSSAQAGFARELAAVRTWREAVLLHVKRAGGGGVALAALAAALARRSEEIRRELAALAAAGRVVLSVRPEAALDASHAAAHEAWLLESLSPAPINERARMPAAPPPPPPWLAAAAERLLAAGRLERHPDPPGYRLPRAAGQPDAAADELRRRLEDHFRQLGLAAPSLAEALRPFPQPAARAAAAALAREGALVACHHDLYLHREAVAGLRRLLAGRRGAQPDFSVADFKAWTGLSRKFVIPLLEYLDRERFTLRRGERREILPWA